MTTGDTLTPKQTLLIEGLLSGLSVKDAAKRANVSLRTAHRWLQRPVVQQALRERERERWNDLSRKLQHYAVEAIDVLADLMRHAAMPSTRLRAAATLLDHTLKVAQLVDLERRIEALEQKLGR